MPRQNMTYRTSKKGLSVIKRFEGLYLKAYRDVAGVWTIGWGSTYGIKRGMKITEKKAAQLLMKELEDKEYCVKRKVKVPLSQEQFDALVSFTYNVGCGAFGRSSLLRKLNDGDYDGAAEQFNRWIYANKRVYLGLKRRRVAERELFEEGTTALVTGTREDVEQRDDIAVEKDLTEAAKTATKVDQDGEIALDTAPAGILAAGLAVLTTAFSREYDMASFTGGVLVTLLAVSVVGYLYMKLRKKN